MADQILPGYPRSVGAQRWIVLDHSGPASYLTGGETMLPWPLSIGGIDWVNLPVPAVSRSGSYSISLYYPADRIGLTARSVQIVWADATTGAEVLAGTNLSGEVVRMQIIGGLE